MDLDEKDVLTAEDRLQLRELKLLGHLLDFQAIFEAEGWNFPLYKVFSTCATKVSLYFFLEVNVQKLEQMRRSFIYLCNATLKPQAFAGGTDKGQAFSLEPSKSP